MNGRLKKKWTLLCCKTVYFSFIFLLIAWTVRTPAFLQVACCKKLFEILAGSSQPQFAETLDTLYSRLESNFAIFKIKNISLTIYAKKSEYNIYKIIKIYKNIFSAIQTSKQ